MARWSCAVPVCRNFKRKGDNSLSWHAFPKSKQIRKEWLVKIRRDLEKNFVINESTRVCSKHFLASDFNIRLHGKLRLLKKNVVPSVFNWSDTSKHESCVKRLKRLAARDKNKLVGANTQKEMDVDQNSIISSEVLTESIEDLTTNANVTDFEKECEVLRSQLESVQVEIHFIKERNETLEKANEDLSKERSSLKLKIENLTAEKQILKSQTLCYENIKHDDKMINFYTGLPDNKTFQGMVKYFHVKIEKCVYWKVGKTELNKKYQSNHVNKPGLERKLNTEDALFLVLLRLKLALPVLDIARIFGIFTPTVSSLFITWITLMFHDFKQIFAIPPLDVIKRTVPPQFKDYPDTTIIIDCTEVKVQKAFALRAQGETFSNYKHTNTVKALIGITPGSLVCFVSPLYGGSASDKHIVKDSGFLELMTPGHCIMADKGFEIETMLPIGVKLNILPKFMEKKTIQMPEKDVFDTRKIANVRVHVERVIRRIKTFRILNHAFPLALIDISEQIVAVCSFLTNFKPNNK